MAREDCWMIDVCKKYECLSALCEASDDNIPYDTVTRCDPGTKTMIAILDSIRDKLEKNGSI